jgi:Uma2 family endonuclease
MSKSPLHSGIATTLYDMLRPRVPAGCCLRKEEPLTLRDSEPEPDLSLVRGSRRDFVTGHSTTAALVVEIAVSSAAEDRSLAALYAEAGVEEYWIVIPLDRRLEVHRRPEAGACLEHVIVEGDATLTRAGVPSVSVRLGEPF